MVREKQHTKHKVRGRLGNHEEKLKDQCFPEQLPITCFKNSIPKNVNWKLHTYEIQNCFHNKQSRDTACFDRCCSNYWGCLFVDGILAKRGDIYLMPDG